jgi:hypothetical protein
VAAVFAEKSNRSRRTVQPWAAPGNTLRISECICYTVAMPDAYCGAYPVGQSSSGATLRSRTRPKELPGIIGTLLSMALPHTFVFGLRFCFAMLGFTREASNSTEGLRTKNQRVLEGWRRFLAAGSIVQVASRLEDWRRAASVACHIHGRALP